MIERKLPVFIFTVLLISIIQTGCQTDKNKQESSSSNKIRIQPSLPLPVVYSNSPQEEEYLENPFIGITTDGQHEKELFTVESTGISTRAIQDAVNNFLSSLDQNQRKKCTFPVDDNEWRRWHNIELYEREGIALFEMNDDQLNLAFHILGTSLSKEGITKVKNIMAMEEYLKEVSKQMGVFDAERLEKLGNDKYWFTFMGLPSDSEPWGWQIDGHHLVINYFILGDQVVMTPTFMGSELTHINVGPNTGIRTFVDEGKKGLALYRSLDQDQKKEATLLERKEVSYSQAEAFKDNMIVPYAGIRASSLDDHQKNLMVELIEEYVGNMNPGHAKVKMTEIRTHLNNTWFGWVGGSGDDDVFYYRIQSPVIMIEYDHHSPVFIRKGDETERKPVNWHVHTVVRTPNGNDYGKDLLRQHLEEHHH